MFITGLGLRLLITYFLFKLEGILPTYYEVFNYSTTPSTKVKAVLDWIDLPESERPLFMAMYLPEIDSKGHQYGPNSREVNDTLTSIDADLSVLINGLSSRGLLNTVNIVIVSDHGMSETNPLKVVFLSDYIDIDLVTTEKNGPMYLMDAVDPRFGIFRLIIETEILSKLEDAASLNGHFNVWSKSTIPDRFHYRNSDRISSMILTIENEWNFVMNRASYNASKPPFPVGHHGYDPELKDMHAIFIGHGPAFRRGRKIAPFENVDVYNILADVMGLTPVPNNGSRWIN